MFERWHDAKNNKDLLKLEYVYQTADQLRDGEVLSLKNPPKRVTLQLEGCPTDGNGYCSWDQFAQALNGALQGTPMEPAAQPTAAAAEDAAKPAENKPAASKGAADKAAADKATADKAAADKAAADKAAAEKAAAQKAAEAKAAEEKAKAAEEKAKAERAAAQKAAAEKAAADKAAADKADAVKPADVPAQKPVESAQNSDAKQAVTQ